MTPAKHGLITNGQITGIRNGKAPHVAFHADKASLVRVPTSMTKRVPRAWARL